LKKAVEWFGISLFAAIILALVGVIIAPHFGWRCDIVYGGSMEPAMDVGSLAVIRPVDPQDVEAGDIITYKWRGESRLMTHRVVEVANNDGAVTFTTKGDANEEPDTWAVPPEDVVGRVWFSVPYAGHAIHNMRTPLGLWLLIGIPATIIILMELRNIWLATRHLRRGSRRDQEVRDE
jgi:signal peptidase